MVRVMILEKDYKFSKNYILEKIKASHSLLALVRFKITGPDREASYQPSDFFQCAKE